MSRILFQIAWGHRCSAVLCSLFAAGFVSTNTFAEPLTPNPEVGTVWWNELVTPNPELSREFYVHVMGWTPKSVAADDNSRPPNPGEPEYTIFMQNSNESAGLTRHEGGEPSNLKPGWLTYIQVADVDNAVTEALRRGGKILKVPHDAQNVGRIAVIEDLDGNAVGLFAPVAKESVP